MSKADENTEVIPRTYLGCLLRRAGIWRRWLGVICRKVIKEWDVALIAKRMPERKRIVRFAIVFSHIPFLLCLSQITEPESEPYPRPPRIRLKITCGLRTFSAFRPHTQIQIQFPHCFPIHRVSFIGRDLAERLQYEFPLMHFYMWDTEAVFF